MQIELEIHEEILLETLSFYEWQNIEKILISLNSKDLVLIETLTLDEMKKIINQLVDKGMVEKQIKKNEIFYRRIGIRQNSFFKRWFEKAINYFKTNSNTK